MTTIICKKCQVEKELNSINFKLEHRTFLGFDTTCKKCRAIRQSQIRKDDPDRFKELDRKARESDRYKKYQKEYRENNLEHLRNVSKENYYKNKEPYLERSKAQKVKLGDSYKEYQREYGKKNRKALNSKYLNKLKTDPAAKLKHTLRSRFNKLIKGYHKKNSVLNYLGCDVDYLKRWISEKFRDGMSWDNHGSMWHIDHIIPCSSFDFSSEEDLKKCWHYTNLQPLYAIENLKKGNRL